MTPREELPLDVRLAALCTTVRAHLLPSDPLCVEMTATPVLAGVDYALALEHTPAPETWIAEWDAVSREIERELAHVAGTAPDADAPVARGRERRWSHHRTVIRALLERRAEGGR